MSVKQLSSKHSPWAVGVNAVKFTIGAETGGNTIKVTVQTVGGAGRVALDAYFSDDDDGSSLLATASSGAVAIADNGLMIDQVAKKAFTLVTEPDGVVDFTIIEAGAKTMYLVVRLPNGSLAISPEITFAA